jgi:hypothetical protein
MAVWVLNHLPLLDFRAYKVGTAIEKEWNSEGLQSP